MTRSLKIAFIGMGKRSRRNLTTFLGFPEVRVVAVCDVDAPRSRSAKDAVDAFYGNAQCQAFEDFRELIDKTEPDAVCISTPDHWHAALSIYAAKKKIHVYCEKPSANSYGESRALLDAVRKHGVIFQTGSYERSGAEVRHACDLIRDGKLGELLLIEVNLPFDQEHHHDVKSLVSVPSPMEIPTGLNFDLWLGPAPVVAYHEKRVHFYWRFHHAFGGGEIGDRGAHLFDIIHLALGEKEIPVLYRGWGRRHEASLYNAFYDYAFEMQYRNGLTIRVGNKGPRGVRFIGETGSVFIHIHGGKTEFAPPQLENGPFSSGFEKLRSVPDHHRDFIRCIQEGGTPSSPIDSAHQVSTMCHLANIALVTQREIRWEPIQEKIVSDKAANRLLFPRIRAPWNQFIQYKNENAEGGEWNEFPSVGQSR